MYTLNFESGRPTRATTSSECSARCEARVVLERAIAQGVAAEMSPLDLSDAHFFLAKSLQAIGDPDRARAEAKAGSRQPLEKAAAAPNPGSYEQDRDRIRAWLVSPSGAPGRIGRSGRYLSRSDATSGGKSARVDSTSARLITRTPMIVLLHRVRRRERTGLDRVPGGGVPDVVLRHRRFTNGARGTELVHLRPVHRVELPDLRVRAIPPEVRAVERGELLEVEGIHLRHGRVEDAARREGFGVRHDLGDEIRGHRGPRARRRRVRRQAEGKRGGSLPPRPRPIARAGRERRSERASARPGRAGGRRSGHRRSPSRGVRLPMMRQELANDEHRKRRDPARRHYHHREARERAPRARDRVKGSHASARSKPRSTRLRHLSRTIAPRSTVFHGEHAEPGGRRIRELEPRGFARTPGKTPSAKRGASLQDGSRMPGVPTLYDPSSDDARHPGGGGGRAAGRGRGGSRAVLSGRRLRGTPGITILFGPSGSREEHRARGHRGARAATEDFGRVALGDDVWFDSERGIDVPAHKRGVAFVFQSLALFPHMSAASNVIYGMNRSLGADQKRARARELLERLRVGHLAEIASRRRSPAAKPSG